MGLRIASPSSHRPNGGHLESRTLTDADVQAIVNELERRATQRFQLNIGRGILALAWKACFYLILWLAAYGAAGGFAKFGK